MEQRLEQRTFNVITPQEGYVLTTWDGNDVSTFGYFTNYEAETDGDISHIHEIREEDAILLQKEADRIFEENVIALGLKDESTIDTLSGATGTIIEG